MRTRAGAMSHCARLALLAVLFLVSGRATTCRQPVPPAPGSLQVSAPNLTAARVRQAYSATLQAQGGRPPYKWSVRSGRLPPGLNLNTETGEIAGVPQAAGAWQSTVAVRDSSRPPRSAEQFLRLPVTAPVEIVTPKVPSLVTGSPVPLPLQARDGVPPYRWELTGGVLPPGLVLDANSGTLAGDASLAGDFEYTVRVTDSATPPDSADRTFIQQVLSPVTVAWVEAPVARDGGIFGSLRIVNATRQAVALTVVVVAVNEIKKAFTLGYRQIQLPPQAESSDIPFGFTMPPGTYTVHADAVGAAPAGGKRRYGSLERENIKVEQLFVHP